ncbi:efflux transporter outer membrane subunit [Desulfobacter postgatei]|uniref:Efflux transporter, outer membrane factor lipoprotein, NodT family n=1 Tax=Desulfobacter postgatei 2ac9 TaxID=879212 RepID=I5AZ52_9BACT|nr:efflux transporter outer membrane subunit [Desulfobacter postgatei]EIM62515.1 efflux transporter, outer membrane factor lipoprotein, NodT family [Desulfobacter postgatei 2ac9]
MENNNKIVHYALIGVSLLTFTGCTVGPDFQRPEPPDVTGYTSTPPAANLKFSPTMLGDPQNIIKEERLNKYWWREMGIEQLDTLICEALEHNPTLMAAEATLRQAQEIYAAKAGSTRYPQAEANLTGQRQRFNPNSSGLTDDAREFGLYNAGVGVTYTFDLAGGNRRALEALAARSDYQHFQLEGARLTLVANIVTTAITQASLKKQAEIIENILKSQENQLELTQERIRLGHEEPDDALALQTQLEQTRAKIPSLQYQLEKNEHFLAVLVGKAPGKSLLPSFTLEDFTLPPELPLLIPSELVHARPDILGAEALLHASNAEYGVAISKLYPQLNLNADLGSQALTTGALFGGGSAVWRLVGQLTQPLFNPGLPAEKRAALAAFDAAAANYQSVVLEALRNVADVLRALENDSKRLEALSAADFASEKFLESTQRRYRLGAASYYDLLIAQQQRLQTELDLTDGQAKRLLNTAVFYQAMGGGLNGITGSIGDVSEAQRPERISSR